MTQTPRDHKKLLISSWAKSLSQLPKGQDDPEVAKIMVAQLIELGQEEWWSDTETSREPIIAEIADYLFGLETANDNPWLLFEDTSPQLSTQEEVVQQRKNAWGKVRKLVTSLED